MTKPNTDALVEKVAQEKGANKEREADSSPKSGVQPLSERRAEQTRLAFRVQQARREEREKVLRELWEPSEEALDAMWDVYRDCESGFNGSPTEKLIELVHVMLNIYAAKHNIDLTAEDASE